MGFDNKNSYWIDTFIKKYEDSFKKVDLLFLEAMATRSETTEEAVGPMPAPGPEKTVVPISSPSIAIIFVLPFTCAIGLLFKTS